LNALVETTLGDVDVIGFCVPANEKLGPGDRFITERLADYPGAKKVAILTKIDTVNRAQLAAKLIELDALREWAAIVPVSAITRGDPGTAPAKDTSAAQLDTLITVLLGQLPESPPLYADTAITDESENDRIAELIREAALAGAREELPHSLATTVDDREERDDGLLALFASLYVERDSQKGIVIGKGGARLREIGESARHEIERLLGRHVFLSLRVKVAKEWQRDPKALGRFGF
jgi:GTP-binding protein Era